MSLVEVLASVPETVRRYEGVFQRERGRRAFAGYPTANALLDAFSPASPVAVDELDRLVQAILTCHQDSGHPLWQALLIAAFGPRLREIGLRDRGSPVERDGRVLLAFLEVVSTLAPSKRSVVAAIDGATARAFARARHAETMWSKRAELDDDAVASVPAPSEEPDAHVACLVREVVTHVTRQPHGADAALLLLGGETASEQAARLGGTTSVDVIYKRTQRVVGAVRRELARR
jgi:hypothetical protein